MIINSCQRCGLNASCKNILRPRGTDKYSMMIINDTPEDKDDSLGLPLLDASGSMLEVAFNSVGLSTENFYITSLLRCKTNDAKITMKDIRACYHYLYREIIALNPQLIITLGNTPLKFFCGNDKSISKYHAKTMAFPLPSPRGKKYNNKDLVYNFYPIYHPSTLLKEKSLKTGNKKWQVWQALIKLKTLYLNLPLN